MAREPIAGMVERNVPSQLEQEDLEAEIELELPGSMDDDNIVSFEGVAQGMDVEVIPEEDGGVTIDFEPSDEKEFGDDFYSNLAEGLSDGELGRISGDLLEQYDANKASRQEWEDAYADGLDLLGFNYEERTQPFQGASGVTHPLLAEAATQFQAQAFNELLPAGGPVRTAILGSESPQKQAQAQRVRQFMNYYITDVMEEYTPELETSDLETCPNITQVMRMSLNDLRKRQISGFYRDIPVIPTQQETDSVTEEINNIDGVSPSQIDYDCTILECHVDLDIEGFEDLDDDGEPTGIKTMKTDARCNILCITSFYRASGFMVWV